MKRATSKAEIAIAFWQYQSSMMWSRVKTVALIEAGGLAGSYKVWGDGLTSLATGILMLASMLLLTVGVLMYRDSQYMEACRRDAGELFPRLIGRPFLGVSGRYIAFGTPILLATVNFCLAYYLAYL